MAYVILAHLVYLLISIYNFNILEIAYVQLVKAGLLALMANIKAMLIESSAFLHVLMEILILHFCVMINSIFLLIEAKLLFYLILVQKTMDLDMSQISYDIGAIIRLLLELQSEFHKYILISQSVNQLSKTLVRLLKDNEKFKKYVKKFKDTNNKIKQVNYTFSYQNDKISEIIKGLSSIHLEKSIQSKGDNEELIVNLKMSLGNLQEQSKDVMAINIDKSLIVEFNKSIQSIKNILDEADKEVSDQIMSIVQQLYIVETIKLGKLYKLISEMQMLYYIIIARVYLLICTIEFYGEIKQTMTQLFGLMKFGCSNVSEFLCKCSEVEKYIGCVSKNIQSCIIKLAKSLNGCKLLSLRPVLIKLYIYIIGIILFLKFYVDLIAREILIFKSIILTLIGMSVSSVFMDGLIFYIFTINNVESAIKSLRECHTYLKAFYLIQIQNSSLIFGLSSRLLFSESIHEHYHVLLFNLQSIKLLIWAIECYIEHLVVFKYTSVCLNSLIDNIAKQLQIIIEIYKVMISITDIMDKLNLVNKRIIELNEIQGDMDITNFKESAKSIRDETESISRETGEINSELKNINGYADSILSSYAILMYLESFLLVLILQVHNYILNSNDPKVLGSGIQNKYYSGMIMKMMEPCNKQLILILGYLLVMWSYIGNLIKLVENTMMVIYGITGWLKALTKILLDEVDKINKGVVNMECAIEGVPRNLIRCSLLSSNTNTTNKEINDNNINNVNVNKVNCNNNNRVFNL